jgi:tetratricopeptide (TPR) repeat protein
MTPPAENAPAARREIGGLGRLPLLGELARHRERLGPILASTVLPFALVVYLALEGGGYDVVIRSQVGMALWWIVLLGALIGVLPVRPLGRAEQVGLGLLLAFAVWTALGVFWSESSERSVEEVARVLTLLAVLALSLSAQDREALRRTVRSIGVAIALVGVLALLSRLEPSWFPESKLGSFLPSVASRLAYPLNYWNGLAALMALGVPLVLVVAVESRRLLTQALATAALPVMALTAYLTLSRGGAIEIAVALTVFLALHPRRLDVLPTLGLGVAGAALAIAAATQRQALEDNLQNATAVRQGDEMLAVILIVCAGVALLRVALGLATRHGLWPRPTVSRQTAALLAGGLATAALAVGLASGASDTLSNAWEDFKQPVGPESNTTAERFSSASGSGRYQYWSSALDADETNPLTGIGPGTFEYWWAENGDIPGFVRDAHSLYFETLGELGIPGLALLLGALGSVFVVGIGKWRRAEGYERALLAAALAAAAAFLTAAAIDWVWEMTVIPVAVLLLAAAVLRTSAGARRQAEGRTGKSVRARIALTALALVSLVVIAMPMLAVRDVRQSQADARAGQLDSALDAARSAERFEGFAATPTLQVALVLEAQGNLDEAAAAAREATRQESTNWRTWFTLSRIEAERGQAEAAANAYRTARSLNPRSAVFASGSGAQP